jgi:hypothetical protein
MTLESGVIYKIIASGTYNFFRNYGNSQGYLADAEWALRHDAYGEGWVKGDGAFFCVPSIGKKTWDFWLFVGCSEAGV